MDSTKLWLMELLMECLKASFKDFFYGSREGIIVDATDGTLDGPSDGLLEGTYESISDGVNDGVIDGAIDCAFGDSCDG